MNNRFSRQSFLGSNSQDVLEQVCIGIIGLGGGGSHICQQGAHLGFNNFRLFDPDIVKDHNLNRMVGATIADVKNKTPKVDVAERVIRNLLPTPKIKKLKSRWQDVAVELQQCDLVFGCVDGFKEREQLEATTRRYLIPYIDIGLDVNEAGYKSYRMAGQIILSMPGCLCMRCLNFLNDLVLEKEAGNYGKAGPSPQVVWANGILASAAIGVAVDLLTDWTKSLRKPVYLLYDANIPYLKEYEGLTEILKQVHCTHYTLDSIGPPKFRTI